MPPEPFVPPTDEYEDLPEARDATAEDETRSADDPQQMARDRQSAKTRAANIAAFWARSLNDPWGRIALWDILAECGTYENRFAAGPTGFPDPLATYHHSGMKVVGQALADRLLRADFEAFYAMLIENHPAFAVRKVKPKRGTE